MPTPNRWRPMIEALEDRTLPSTTSLPVAPVVSSTVRTAAAVHLALQGTINGTWTTTPATRTVTASQALTGAGSVVPLGAARLTGQLVLRTAMRAGQSAGTLTLTTAAGTLTLSLVAPWAPNPHSPVTLLSYTVSRGTGRYAGATASGVVALLQNSAGTRPGSSTAVQAFTLAF